MADLGRAYIGALPGHEVAPVLAAVRLHQFSRQKFTLRITQTLLSAPMTALTLQEQHGLHDLTLQVFMELPFKLLRGMLPPAARGLNSGLSPCSSLGLRTGLCAPVICLKGGRCMQKGV